MPAEVDIQKMTNQIMAQAVPQAMITAEDQAALTGCRAFLLSLEDRLVSVFYDTLFAHAPTAAVFAEGERAAREETLRVWWRRTVGEPLDEDYFRWMTLVGIVHIRRRVTNPMMLSMLDVSRNVVLTSAQAAGVDAATQERLRVAFGHLTTAIAMLIADSYTLSYIGALEDLAGLDPKLVSRMLSLEVTRMEAEARKQLGR